MVAQQIVLWYLDVASQVVCQAWQDRGSQCQRGYLELHGLAKDSFVSTCEELPFGDCEKTMWQERKKGM